MGFDLDRVRAYRVPDSRDRYDQRDTILYALGTGAGLSDADELQFTYERGLVALPTMALVQGTAGFWPMDPALGLDWRQILHGEQSLRLHRPLWPAGEVTGKTVIGGIADKGPGRPVLMQAVRELTDANSGAPWATLEEVWVLRGMGGFGGENVPVSEPLPAVPDRPADTAIDLPTSPQQAALYRLTGDRNPLHIDPVVAAAAGFDRPILHGLATFGLIGRALIHRACGGDARRLTAMRLRFTAPVYPGDTIRTEIWDKGDATRFRASVPARDVVVADAGMADCNGFPPPIR